MKYHPATGLSVVYVVHDSLYGFVAKSSEIFYVKNDTEAEKDNTSNDKNLSTFIVHTIRSPLRWYFKSLVLDSLCGICVSKDNPVRVIPVGQEVMVMHSLINLLGQLFKSKQVSESWRGNLNRIVVCWVGLAFVEETHE